MSSNEKKYVEVVTSLTNNEIKRIKKLNDILTRLCEENSDIADLVEIMFWDNSWNSKTWRNKSVEYYMRLGLEKYLSTCGINNNEPDINCDWDSDVDIVNKMNTHRILLEDALFFITYYIHNKNTDPKKSCFGVKIDVTDNDIIFNSKIFKNEKEMNKEGYSNEASYYMSRLNEYGINRMYANKNN